MGWTVQGSEQAQPYEQRDKQALYTSGQGHCGEAFMRSWWLSTCEQTEMIQGLFNPQCMRYMETSMKELPAARGTRWGTVTATADEGFPTPSSSGREASGAE